ncbi:trypsin-like serine peptidase [Falsiporphyromonas endometrii]|uniref:Trypsin-like serine peptidase n=1 Tax=Falsiporphyromonas endometrii TaxID=1387297 RepID=A0ABV9K9Q4_9PORP
MKLYKYITTIASVLTLFSAQPVLGQISYQGSPLLTSDNADRVSLRSTGNSSVDLPPIDSTLIYNQEEWYSAQPLRGAVPFAVARKVNYNIYNSGKFYRVKNRLVWQLSLRSNRAKSIGLSFDKFHLTQGSKLFVYASDESDVRGAFTEKNNNPSGILTIAPILSDHVIIECQLPYSDMQEIPSDFNLELTEVYHGYRSLRGRSEHNPGEPWNTFKGFDCAPNVISHPEVSKEARATVLMIVGGTTVCTGSLINNTRSDGKPYILTSSHCVNGLFRYKNNINYCQIMAAHTVFFFGFDSPSKKYFYRGVEQTSISGSKVVALNENSDMCLLEMTGLEPQEDGTKVIPASFKPYYEGWNISTSPKGQFVGIHHPSSAVKRYSRTREEQLEVKDYNAGSLNWKGKHFFIKTWEVGTTAPGSSGSPLFDNQGLVIGALSGGNSYCSTPYDDFYWALFKTWRDVEGGDYDGGVTRSIGKLLDPDNTGNTICRGFDPYAPFTPIRISRVMVSPNESIEYDASSDLIKGIGVQYNFPSKVRILGAYMVVPPMEPRDGSKVPPFDLMISKRINNQEQWQKVYLDQAKPAGYQYHLLSDENVQNGICSTYDTTDIFIPVYDKDNNKPYIDIDGPVDILASIMARDNNVLMPLVRLKNDEAERQSTWYNLGTEEWTKASDFTSSPYKGNYWIDLLVQPIGENLPIDTVSNISGYFLNGKFFIIFPSNENVSTTTIRVFNYLGECVKEDHFKGIKYSLNMRNFLPANYIVTVYYKGKKYSYPILMK